MDDFLVVTGEQNRSRIEGTEKKYQVVEVKEHQFYNHQSEETRYDIALLRLDEAISFGPLARPVCLAGPNTQAEPGDICTISGWGLTTGDFQSLKLNFLLTTRFKSSTLLKFYKHGRLELHNRCVAGSSRFEVLYSYSTQEKKFSRFS